MIQHTFTGQNILKGMSSYENDTRHFCNIQTVYFQRKYASNLYEQVEDLQNHWETRKYGLKSRWDGLAKYRVDLLRFSSTLECLLVGRVWTIILWL
jgi:hypothetical protein